MAAVEADRKAHREAMDALDKTDSIPMDDISESQLQRECERVLTFHKVVFLHLSFKAREKKGWPDLTFCVRGQGYAVELKTATGVLSEDQKQCLEQMASNGWRTKVVRSVKEFIELIKDAENEAKT